MKNSAYSEDQAWIEYCGRDESVGADPRTVIIGDLEWTAKNLNTGKFRNADPVPQARTREEWISACHFGMPAWCYYENNPDFADLFGKLYNRFALEDERGIVPEGWRIPGYEDWHNVVEELGSEAGREMKSRSGWNEDGGTNSSRFNALPCGSRYGNGGFYGMGENAVFAERGGGRFYITGVGTLVGGFPESFGGRTNNPQRNDGLAVRCVRDKLYSGFDIVPSGVPNPGIMFINREATGRSGHMGNSLTECNNGDILAFYSNTSGIIRGGHLPDGWTEYRRSVDGGRSWQEPKFFEYSKNIWEENRVKAKRDDPQGSLVTAAVTAPNGNVVAFSIFWGKQAPVYHLSYDNGQTWSETRRLDETAAGEDVGYTYDAVFVHEDTIFALFVGGRGASGPVSLYVSTDNGESFVKRSDNLFPDKTYQWYQTGRVLEDGRMVVYVYNGVSSLEYLYYVVSEDKGHTWSVPETMHLKKRIRNPQMSDKIGEFYFMHGRSGSRGPDPGNLVLYKSRDGLHWDDGIFLNKQEGVLGAKTSGGQAYSANTVVGAHDPSIPNRLLIQSSIGYCGKRVNTKHWWIENPDDR